MKGTSLQMDKKTIKEQTPYCVHFWEFQETKR